MYGGAGGALAASVTKAGGFGFIGAGYSFYKNLPKELEIAKQQLSISDEGGKKVLQIGVGFITFEIVTASAKSKSETGSKWPLVDIALENKVKAVWFSFGDASELIHYVRTKSPGTIIFAQVTTAEEAIKAVREWKVDIVVLQGSESGGHGSANNMTTFTLVPQAVAELSTIAPKVPLLAAGGVTTGRQVAAALALGADGVVVGSAFLPSPESLFSAQQRNAVLQAKDGNATVRTGVFDIARGIDWPAQFDGRALKNKTTEEYDQKNDVSRFREVYKKAIEEGDVSRQAIFVGQGVGLVNDAKPAGDVVKQLTADAITEVHRLRSLTSTSTSPTVTHNNPVQVSKL